MKIVHTSRNHEPSQHTQAGDGASLLGIVAGVGLLLPGFALADSVPLLLPFAFALLVPSLLYGSR